MTPEEQAKHDAEEKAKAEAEANKGDKKTFTQEDLEKALSERLKREREKADKALAEKLKSEREDWERQAKLSASEKETETQKKREAETAERERGITLRENRAEARDLLSEKSIPAALVDFVVDVDLDKTKANIDVLEEAYLKAVEAGVNDKLKGQTPVDKTTLDTDSPKFTGTTSI
jgi:hypothetical protein